MTYSTRIVSVLAVLAALVLAGCSDDDKQAAATLKPLAVKEQASSIVKGDDGYVVNWAGVLANRNPWHFGEHTVATVVAKDASGKEVVRLDQPLDAVPPADSLSFSGHVVAAEKPATVSIQYRPAQWRQAGRIVSSFLPFPISDVLTDSKEGSYLITGYVGTPYRRPAESLAVTALLRDKAGKLLGGEARSWKTSGRGEAPLHHADQERRGHRQGRHGRGDRPHLGIEQPSLRGTGQGRCHPPAHGQADHRAVRQGQGQVDAAQ
ncbi:hypothetical protein ACFQX6_44485 [Streptosporangium lutulentum]